MLKCFKVRDKQCRFPNLLPRLMNKAIISYRPPLAVLWIQLYSQSLHALTMHLNEADWTCWSRHLSGWVHSRQFEIPYLLVETLPTRGSPQDPLHDGTIRVTRRRTSDATCHKVTWKCLGLLEVKWVKSLCDWYSPRAMFRSALRMR